MSTTALLLWYLNRVFYFANDRNEKSEQVNFDSELYFNDTINIELSGI